VASPLADHMPSSKTPHPGTYKDHYYFQLKGDILHTKIYINQWRI